MQRVPRNYGDRTGVDEYELALQNTLPEVMEGALEELHRGNVLFSKVLSVFEVGEIYHI